MGGACSRKRDQQDNEDNLVRGVSGKYCKSGSSKWLATSFSRPSMDIQLGRGNCPSLMDLCVQKIREVLFNISSWVQDCNSLNLYLIFASLSYRMLIGIEPFRCSQGTLVSRSLMN